MSASGSAAFAYDRRGSGQGQSALVDGDPMTAIASASSSPRPSVPLVVVGHLDRSERREGHRPSVGGTLRRPVIEVRDRAGAHRILGSAACCGAERPQAPTPTVLDAVTSVPAPPGVAAIADPAVHVLRLRQESKRRTTQVPNRLAVCRFPNGDDEQPGDVVGAVPLFSTRFAVVSVFEHPDPVAHRHHVCERGQCHDGTGRREATISSASSA